LNVNYITMLDGMGQEETIGVAGAKPSRRPQAA
jgi:hypothetical protein